MSRSRWRTQAWHAINDTLASLPEDAPIALKRKAVSQAYPFGERKGWPYVCWLREVRERLGPSEPQEVPQCRVVLVHEPPLWLLRVECGWCQSAGCMVCLPRRSACQEASAHPDWWRWCQALREDPAALVILADWLEDRGLLEVAEACRRKAMEEA